LCAGGTSVSGPGGGDASPASALRGPGGLGLERRSASRRLSSGTVSGIMPTFAGVADRACATPNQYSSHAPQVTGQMAAAVHRAECLSCELGQCRHRRAAGRRAMPPPPCCRTQGNPRTEIASRQLHQHSRHRRASREPDSPAVQRALANVSARATRLARSLAGRQNTIGRPRAPDQLLGRKATIRPWRTASAGSAREAATQDKEICQLEIDFPGSHRGYERSPLFVAED